jgi:fibronectin-binding autotransporter adhesin
VKKILLTTIGLAAVTLGGLSSAQAQTNNYFGGSGALNGSTWSTNPAGPFTSPFDTTGGGIANFDIAGNMSGGSITFAGINATQSVTLSGTSGTISMQGNGVIPVDIASNAVLDFGSQSWSSSGTAGLIKNGDGVLALAGNTYGGGFTLNSGTVLLRGVNAMGGGSGNTLNLNGGILAGNASRTLTDKYSGGITFGGDVQFGAFSSQITLASDTANITFNNDMDLGGAHRTLTLGNRGDMRFQGVISNGSLTFAAVAGAEASVSGNGEFDLQNTANTFTGLVSILGPEVVIAADGSLGNSSNDVLIDGGRLTATGMTINSGRTIFLGETVGTSISVTGASNASTFDGVIADNTGDEGTWDKQGAGTLFLGGDNTYTGATTINNGTVVATHLNALGNANNAGITIGSSQQLRLDGLNGTLGNTGPINVSGSGTSTDGNGTIRVTGTISEVTMLNSMVLAASTDSSIFVTNSNTLIMEGDISGGDGAGIIQKGGGGLLVINGIASNAGGFNVTNGLLGGSGTITGDVTLAGGGIAPGNSPGTLAINGDLSLNNGANFVFELGTASDLIAVGGGFNNIGTGPYTFEFFDAGGLAETTYTLLTFGSTNFVGVDDFTFISSISGLEGNFILGADSLSFQVTVIPEPSSMLLLGLGGLALFARRKFAARP